MTLTIGTIIELFNALSKLNGTNKVVKQGESEIIINQPFDLGKKAKWNIAKNLTILKKYNDEFNETRDNYIKQLTNGESKIDEKQTKLIVEFQEQINKELKREIDINGLLKIKLDDFNLDINRNLNPSILSDLMPLIDDGENVNIDAKK